ncbi:unnamed protein product [Brassicogethes aeneus]|uniref:Nuclear migration protein nudC n=1 Tax=Brassicogethes aeneus TaxID=1431903 RepID=A0A9P0BLF3_BRAAE|nr:unnamed protein product [Brassicogethes aeneus]
MGNHDDMLFTMLTECKTLPRFLDEIFGFLLRRTDFYHIQEEENSPVGLPEGLAERIVRHSLFKWKPQNVYSEDEIPVACEETIVEDVVECQTEEIGCVEDMEKLDINKKNKEKSFSTSDCYNGAVCENYSWSQTIGDVDIVVKIPEGIKAKELIVKIESNLLLIKTKDGDVLLDGEFCQKCKNNDAIWSLVNQNLEIHLDKTLDMWWDCLLRNEEKLDISKIDCSRPYEELPEEAQAKIEELQWNQERKIMGLPTSDEMALQEKLKKAWNVEGSPFTGPFDPSKVKFS